MDRLIFIVLGALLACLIIPGLLSFSQALLLYVIIVCADYILAELKAIKKLLEDLRYE